jgi:hypothetical protein
MTLDLTDDEKVARAALLTSLPLPAVTATSPTQGNTREARTPASRCRALSRTEAI